MSLLREIGKRIAVHLPPIRRLRDERQSLAAEVDRLRGELSQTQRPMADMGRAVISKATEESWFSVLLNGDPVLLPKYTIMTMLHCLQVESDGALKLWVETEHWKRMKESLGPGSLFVDVGAATGAMSVLYGKLRLPGLTIVAFEPSRTARRVLSATLARNFDYGIVQFRLDGSKLGESLDFYSRENVFTTVTLSTVELTAGDHTFSAEIVGSNPAATPRHMLGLDCLRLVPADP